MTQTRFKGFFGSLFIIMGLSVAAFLVCSCDPEIDPPDTQRPEAFTAELEGWSYYFGDEWPDDAAIKVFLPEDKSGRTFQLTDKPSQHVATFQQAGFNDYDRAVAAVYPASSQSELAAEGAVIALPRTRRQTGETTQQFPGIMTLVAKGDTTGRLDFKLLCGSITLCVKSSLQIREVHLISNKDEALWGDMAVALGNAFPTAVISGNTSEERNSLVVIAGDSAQGTSGSESFTTGSNSTVIDGTIPDSGEIGQTGYFHFVVPVGTLQDGFRVIVIDQRGGYMEKSFPAQQVERGRGHETEAAYRDASEDVEIRTDVLNKAFYKDLYLNSGLFLTTNDTLPVSDFLGLDIEHLMAARTNPTAADYAAQTAAFSGSVEDVNGRLLYPDGEPRYRMVYVRGGGSTDHGFSLGSDGREHFRAFVKAGGSYLGSCAGAYLSSKGSSINASSSGNYLGIWPGYCNSLSTKQIYPGHVIPPDSPLLQYYDFGGDFYIDSVRHHNGPCFINYDYVPGTEVLTRFDIPDSTKMHGNPAIIAWKENKWTGRIIPCGSHPEQIPQGDNLLLMAAMVRYCFDGVGIAKVKGILHNGEVRQMTCRTEDLKPAYTRIGDRQCHHFVFALPEGARNVRLRLVSLDGYNLSLRLAKGTFAFREDALYRLENSDTSKELLFPTLEAGTWYVGVQCEDVPTVVTNHGKYGTEYADTGILNGAPYTVSVSWDY